MNNIFSFKRLFLVLRRDLADGWKKHLLLALGLFSGMLIVFMISSMDNYSETSSINRVDEHIQQLNRRHVFYAVWMFILASIAYVSMMMEPMKGKKRRIQYLMLPASVFEKYLSRLLQYTVGFLIVFLISFFLMDLVRVAICSVLYPQIDVHFIDLGVLVGDSKFMFRDLPRFWIGVSNLLLILSLATLGTTFWQKNAFIKNLAAIVALLFAFFWFVNWMMRMLSDNEYIHKNTYLNPDIFFSSESAPIVIPILLFLSIFNWTLAYFRFKELDIIEKW